MEDLPSEQSVRAAETAMEDKEERDRRVFAPSVDMEEAGTCLCQGCPPDGLQDEEEGTGGYCCASLFSPSFRLLKKGEQLRDGLTKQMKEHPSLPCICLDPHIKDYVLSEIAARSAAETHSMLTGKPIEDQNRAYRYGAYRLFVASTMGYLGAGTRIRLPTCFVHAARQKWPSAKYTGYISSK